MERSDVGFASEGRSFPIISFHGRREPSPICGGVCQPLELANISMSPPLEILRWLCSRLTPPVSISLSSAYLTESMDRPGRSRTTEKPRAKRYLDWRKCPITNAMIRLLFSNAIATYTSYREEALTTRIGFSLCYWPDFDEKGFEPLFASFKEETRSRVYICHNTRFGMKENWNNTIFGVRRYFHMRTINICAQFFQSHIIYFDMWLRFFYLYT